MRAGFLPPDALRKTWFGGLGLVFGVPAQAHAQGIRLPMPSSFVEYILFGLISGAALLVVSQVTYQAFTLYRDSRHRPAPGLAARRRDGELLRREVPVDAFELPLNVPAIVMRPEPPPAPVVTPPPVWLGETDRTVNQW